MEKYNLQSYLEKKQQLNSQKPVYRKMCTRCLCPQFSCYCEAVYPFDPVIEFAILIHPIEFTRRIATGRMSHLILKGSHLIKGQDYTNNPQVNDLIQQSDAYPVILYPGVRSTNISELSAEQKASLFPSGKKIILFVIDGTWATARKMIRQSENLQNLPRICFSPTAPSNFRVRKQPAAHCVSTIEAIHQTLDLIGPHVGFATDSRQHDDLLNAFDYMVEKQLDFIKQFA